MDMPKINLDAVDYANDFEREVTALIVAGQGKNKGCLRAAKPKIDYEIIIRNGGRYREASKITGCAAYLWRMVAFQISPLYQHHCLPMMADCDLPYFKTDKEERAALKKQMDNLADKVCNTIPKNEWHGIKRWANVL